MGPAMNLTNNGKMDWFFDEYVYGTELPTYHFEGQTTPNDKGVALHFKLTQAGVAEAFRMPIPIYLEYASGKVLKLGAINITGDRTIEETLAAAKATRDGKEGVDQSLLRCTGFGELIDKHATMAGQGG